MIFLIKSPVLRANTEVVYFKGSPQGFTHEPLRVIFHFPWHRHQTEGAKALKDAGKDEIISKLYHAPFRGIICKIDSAVTQETKVKDLHLI